MGSETTFKSIYDESFVRDFAHRFARVDAYFDAQSFFELATSGLFELELKGRVVHISCALEQHLHGSYEEQVEKIMRVLEPAKDVHEERWSGFFIWPLTMFVQRYGLDHFETSMRALYVLTQHFTAEFAIRQFLINDPHRTLATLRSWINDPSEHVRRLISEGTRTRLPWGIGLVQFIKEPEPVLELLEALREDDALYVRRSVANSFNDLSRDHPDLVVETLQRWSQEVDGEEMRWLVKHALRTLIKQGHAGALMVLGFDPEPSVEVEEFVASEKVHLGSSLSLSVTLRSTAQKEQRLVVDFIMHHVRKNGHRVPKVFKLKTFVLKAQDTMCIQKEHAMRRITTRTYYPGTHRVELTINGAVMAGADFEFI